MSPIAGTTLPHSPAAFARRTFPGPGRAIDGSPGMEANRRLSVPAFDLPGRNDYAAPAGDATRLLVATRCCPRTAPYWVGIAPMTAPTLPPSMGAAAPLRPGARSWRGVTPVAMPRRPPWRPKNRYCPVCGIRLLRTSMPSERRIRRDAIYCSPRCRTRRWRASCG